MLERPLEAHERIIVALDVPTLGEAEAIVRELIGRVGGFKVGLELLTATGSEEVVGMVHNWGGRVFYDAKFHDIPNTMAGAARAVAGLGVWAFNVHASAGREGIAAAAREKGSSLLLAVTVLTSLDDEACVRIYGLEPTPKVFELAYTARHAGADGIICSPRELPRIRGDRFLDGLITVVPGVRPAWAGADDQSRIMTPGEAVVAGADYLVIGRPITRPPSSVGGRADAVGQIVSEIEGVQP
jgi:orotidine-5'-phosphate decarboxylase